MNRRLRILFFIGGFTSLVRFAWGQSLAPLELTFDHAIRMAGEQPAAVVMSHERVQQAVARLSQARTSLLPQLSASASEERRTVNLAAEGITIPGINPKVGPFDTFDARLKLTQALFDAETLQSLRFAKAGQGLAEQQKRKAQQDTMALVATLYIEAQRAQEQITLGRTLKDCDEQELALAHSNLNLGTTMQIDVDEIEARLADTERFLTTVQAQAEERRLDLAAALDLPVDQPIIFKETSLLPPSEVTEPITSADVEAHPDVAVARETLRQRQANAGVIKAGYVPKVSASADYGASGQLPKDSFGTYSYGGQLSLPIFEGGDRQKRVEEAQHQILESQTQLEDTRIQTQAKAKSAAESVQSSWAEVQSRQTALRVENKQLGLALQRLRLGVGSLIELTEEQARNAQAWDDCQEAVATYQMARVTEAQALGKMESLVRP